MAMDTNNWFRFLSLFFYPKYCFIQFAETVGNAGWIVWSSQMLLIWWFLGHSHFILPVFNQANNSLCCSLFLASLNHQFYKNERLFFAVLCIHSTTVSLKNPQNFVFIKTKRRQRITIGLPTSLKNVN